MDADDDQMAGGEPAFAVYLPAVTWFASFLLGCAVVLMTAQVILRFGFNAPQAWAEEVDRYLFIWAVYLGAAVALIKGTHIRVTFIIDLFPGGEALSQWLTRIVGVLAFGFTAYHGYDLFWVNRTSEFYTIPGMPQGIFYLAAPVGLTIMCLHLLLLILADLLRSGEK